MADFVLVVENKSNGFGIRKDVCLVCYDEVDGGFLVQMPCQHSHRMCKHCVRAAFYCAAEREQNYPPRCCGKAGPPLQLADYAHLLAPELITKYKEREVEYATRGKRTYCAKSNCSAFIPNPNHINDGTAARCHKCCLYTCTGCNVLINPNQPHTCSTVQDDAFLIEQARLQRWKQCWNCRGIIELMEACNHITCACRAEFCYICGTPWSGNPCPQGCPEYGEGKYDDDGYATHGRRLHRDTGLDRMGLDFEGYDADGFNRYGYSRYGLDVNGNSRTQERDLQSTEAGPDGTGSGTHASHGGRQSLDEAQAAVNDPELHFDEMLRNFDSLELEPLQGDNFDTAEEETNDHDENSNHDWLGFTVEMSREEFDSHHDAQADHWFEFDVETSNADSDSEDDNRLEPAHEGEENQELRGDPDSEKIVGFEGGLRDEQLNADRPDQGLFLPHAITPYHLTSSFAQLDCEHTWHFLHGPGTCHVCQWHAHVFTMSCSECGAQVCRRCSDDYLGSVRTFIATFGCTRIVLRLRDATEG